MSKNLAQIFKDKKITRQADKTKFIKENTIVVAKTNNGNGHSYGPAGSEVSWINNNTYWQSNGTYLAYLRTSAGSSGNSISITNLTVRNYMEFSVEGLKQAQKDIDKEQKELTERKKEIKLKLEFLKEAGVDGFSDNEYKAYMTLKTFERKDMNAVEKAKAIAKLIDG